MGVTTEEFRRIMRRVPAGVSVITARGADGFRGMTAGSLVSLSLDPPLVCFNVMKDSLAHGVFQQAQGFAVSLLAEGQALLADRFAVRGLAGWQQFDGVGHRLDPDGNPWLDGAVGWMSCRRHGICDGGDHSIILGEVIATEEGESLRPLLYHDGAYHTLGDPTA